MEKEKKSKRHFSELIQEPVAKEKKKTGHKHFSEPKDDYVNENGKRGYYAEKIHMDVYIRLKKEELDPDGVDMLIQALVHKAAYDYKHGRRLGDKEDAERFFKSEWFTSLTGLDGAFMLKQLEKYDLAKMEDKI